MPEAKTLADAMRRYGNAEAAADRLRGLKWPDGKITCPHCGSDQIGEVATRDLHRCRTCRKMFTPRAGTIFEGSALGLDAWFVAVWCFATPEPPSSYALAKALGITQKSAWYMLHRVEMATHTAAYRKLNGDAGDVTFAELLERLAKVPKEKADAAHDVWAAKRAEHRRRGTK